MPNYEYECCNCENILEFYHKFDEKPLVLCTRCNSVCYKILSVPLVTEDRLYHFVDWNTTGKNIEFTGKDQWQKHLKKHRMHDDIPQRPIKESEIKPYRETKTKEQKRKEYADVLIPALKEYGVIK